VNPASLSAWMTSSIDVFWSSISTMTVCAFISAATELTLATFSTASRAFAEVPPQTTPGVSRT
jgi:hypothetical protein